MAWKAINQGVTEVTEKQLLRKSSPASACGESFAEIASVGHFGHQHRNGLPILERASKYVNSLPPAMSGSRGHDAPFRVACFSSMDSTYLTIKRGRSWSNSTPGAFRLGATGS
jgi:hypothetical protein